MTLLSAKTRYYFQRILPFGIIWLVLAWMFLSTEYAALGDFAHGPKTAIKVTPLILLFACSAVFVIGCIVGVLEVFFVNRLFEKRSLPQKIIGKFCIYAVLLSILILVSYLIAASIEMDTSIFDKKVWKRYTEFFFSITYVSTLLQVGFSLLLSLLYAEISDNLGSQVLLNFFTGKYHKPTRESRIFMFVDMKDSTTIAEAVGSTTYFKLLQSYYYDFSNAIINNYGEVYQYVGDEIVITWKVKKGLNQNYCVRCFFDMEKALQNKSKFYLRKFGVVPQFKAGMHCGEVTTGEIGALKKDIFFTGDVLNTTARILGLCSTYQKNLLLSKELVKQLSLGSEYVAEDLGSPQLKGKVNSINVMSVEQVSQ
ncbi:adenylate/guanylate cyclase domain-containing protein [Rasiella rasia]|uniref:Adenylate/guanylate cyclase domain-containing protein n=1 Tax=Rasiella rasia TaxID=2744027 RepID=A0A6G6GLP6_9FLAO|nr:adenylate/guanylate cyclase domain-containing protein [Rasiella rasia]QIE59444.1 adenylate/guanylate cyclase domain-containing protein [Rasiella rasia]